MSETEQEKVVSIALDEEVKVPADIGPSEARASKPHFSSGSCDASEQFDAKPNTAVDTAVNTASSNSLGSWLLITACVLWFLSDPGYNMTANAAFVALKSRSTVLVNIVVVSFLQFFCCVVGGGICARSLASEQALSRSVRPRTLVSASLIAMSGLSQVFQMAALGLGTLPFAQMLRATEPVFLLLLSWLVLHEPLSGPLLVATLPMYIGASTFSFSDGNFSLAAMAMGMCSNLLLVGRNVLSKRVLDDGQNAFSVLFEMSLIPCVVLCFGLCLLALSGENVLEPLSNPLFIISGLAFFIFRSSSLVVLAEISLLAHSLLKLLRRFCIAIIASIVSRATFTPIMTASMVGVFSGAFAFEITSITQQKWSTSLLSLAAVTIACVISYLVASPFLIKTPFETGKFGGLKMIKGA